MSWLVRLFGRRREEPKEVRVVYDLPNADGTRRREEGAVLISARDMERFEAAHRKAAVAKTWLDEGVDR